MPTRLPLEYHKELPGLGYSAEANIPKSEMTIRSDDMAGYSHRALGYHVCMAVTQQWFLLVSLTNLNVSSTK